MTLKRPADVNRPRFTYRKVFARDGDDEAYRAHNLLNGRSHHRTSIPPSPQLNSWCNQWKDGGHNLHRIVSKQKYGAEHPEYFAGNQLAMMNENVRHIAATTLIEKWKNKRPEDMAYMAMGQQFSDLARLCSFDASVDVTAAGWQFAFLASGGDRCRLSSSRNARRRSFQIRFVYETSHAPRISGTIRHLSAVSRRLSSQICGDRHAIP